jgi:prevent-host-death family protein
VGEASARELRDHGDRVLDRVLGGERITITRGGEPVAELVPLRRCPLSAEALIDLFRGDPPMDPAEFRAQVAGMIDQNL